MHAVTVQRLIWVLLHSRYPGQPCIQCTPKLAPTSSFECRRHSHAYPPGRPPVLSEIEMFRETWKSSLPPARGTKKTSRFKVVRVLWSSQTF